MNIRTDLSLLAGGVLLALAGVALSAAHDPVPAFVEWGAIALIGGAAGVAIPPSPTSSSSSSPASTVESAAIAAVHSGIAQNAANDAREIVAEIRGLISSSTKPQVAKPTPTPTSAPIAAPAPAEGVAVPPAGT